MMNSRTLTRLGFSEWLPWCSTVAMRAPCSPGVYAFRRSRGNIPRLKGASDILYIGKAERQPLSTRLSQWSSNKQLRRVVQQDGPIEIAWRVEPHGRAAVVQEALLHQLFGQSHLELPPLNRSAAGKPIQEAFDPLCDLSEEERIKKLQGWIEAEEAKLRNSRRITGAADKS